MAITLKVAKVITIRATITEVAKIGTTAVTTIPHLSIPHKTIDYITTASGITTITTIA